MRPMAISFSESEIFHFFRVLVGRDVSKEYYSLRNSEELPLTEKLPYCNPLNERIVGDLWETTLPHLRSSGLSDPSQFITWALTMHFIQSVGGEVELVKYINEEGDMVFSFSG